VAIRLGPNGLYNDTGLKDYREAFLYYIAQLSPMRLAYLHVVDGLAFGFHNLGQPLLLSEIRKVYDGVIIGNCGYTKETAEKTISSGDADLISFGRDFMSNPDLVERWAMGAAVNPSADMSVFYSAGGENLGAKGYIDFPTLAE
jgi:N-ethylmaleimide reductase